MTRNSYFLPVLLGVALVLFGLRPQRAEADRRGPPEAVVAATPLGRWNPNRRSATTIYSGGRPRLYRIWSAIGAVKVRVDDREFAIEGGCSVDVEGRTIVVAPDIGTGGTYQWLGE